MEKFYIYKILNKTNGKIYIGKTKDPAKRWSVHKTLSVSNKSKLYNSIRKYGLDNFEFEIIAEVLLEKDAYDLETEIIKQFNSYHNGLNSSLGGSGSGSGINHRNFGKPLSEEVKRKISKTQRGGTGLNKDKVFTKETRKKISENRKGIPMLNNTKNKLSLAKTPLTEDQIRLIKMLLLENNLKQKEIAIQFNVSEKLISLIKSGKRFSFVI